MFKFTLNRLPDLADELGMERSKDLLESFFFACRIRNLTQTTMRGYGERLYYLLRYADSIGKELDTLDFHDLQRYVMSIVEKVSAATVNGRIVVYKVFYKHLIEEGLIDKNPAENLKKVRAPKRIKPVVSPDDLGKVLSKLDRKKFHGSRNYCMILLTYDAMLRLDEMLSIKIDNIDLRTKLVKVYGKGRKERIVPFSDLTARGIHTYLLRHRKGIFGDFLFCTTDGEKIKHRRAMHIFTNAGRRVGVYIHAHLCRHSGATEFARSGGNLAVLQRVLGHSSLTITQRYLHLSNEDMQHAYETHAPTANLRIP